MLEFGESSGFSTKLAIGGDFAEVNVFDLKTHRCDLRLLQSDMVHAVSITRDLVCFTSGSTAKLYGQAGMRYSWREQPSFAHIMRTLQAVGTDEHRQKYMQELLHRHPAVANACDPDTGESLIQEIVRCGWADHSRMVGMLLSSSCSIGLRPDYNGDHPLAVALTRGKLQPAREVLRAVRNGTIVRTPQCMRLVARSFALLASKYPAEFLDFIKEMPLEDEPEVLTTTMSHEVTLPPLMVRGSEERCPKGIWNTILQEAERRTEQMVEETSSLMKDQQKYDATRVRNSLKGRESLWTLSETEHAKEGFPRGMPGGLCAMRVPFEHFAGHFDCVGGVRTSILQLAIDAVTVTRDYSVFGTRSMRILLDFKWRGYARSTFLRRLLFFLLHLLWTTFFILEASKYLDDTYAPENIDVSKPQHLFLILGWTQTTIVSMIYLRETFRRALATGLYKYVTDGQEMLNMTYNASQLIVNVLFWLRKETPWIVFAPIKLNTTDMLSDSLCGSSTLSDKERDDPGILSESGTLGIYLTLQSVVMLSLFFRMLFFFRGFLGFAALMNIAVETTKVIVPFLVLLITLTFGFGLSTYVLMQHTVFQTDKSYESEFYVLWSLANAGFRFIPPDTEPYRARWQIIVLYCLYMFGVQMILLNLLVAMMAGTFTVLHTNAQLMAEAERGKLILQLEPEERTRRRSRRMSDLLDPALPGVTHVPEGPLQTNRSFDSEDSNGNNAITLRSMWSSFVRIVMCRSPESNQSSVYPTWLHVLIPASSDDAVVDNRTAPQGEGVSTISADGNGPQYSSKSLSSSAAIDRLDTVESKLQKVEKMIERVLEHEGGRENLMMRQNEAITQLLQDPPKHCASFLENLRQGRI